ncbi:MAG: CRISPR-associated endonuclease Cas2 [Archaeoglobaceae archaeon]|nr:CRISPR-associated endonuclease Cas2 [Archaeoglobaceae archaeon]
MYVIIAYDVNVARVNRVKKFLRKHLNWVQNSVFEGELTKADFEEVKLGLNEIIDREEDMVVFYILRSEKALKKEVLGFDKSKIDEII